MLTIQELKKLSGKELQKEWERATSQLLKAELNLRTNQDKKSHVARDLRRYRAQIKTIQNQPKETTTI